MHIERAAHQTGQSYVDTVLKFCEDHLLEPDEVSSKINKSLREKIEREFRELNYLPKVAELDV